MPVGAIVKDMRGAYFIIETGGKRRFPDASTLSALSLSMGGKRAATVTDAILNSYPTATPFASLAGFVSKHPEIEVQRAVNALLPATGIKGAPERIAFIVEASASLFNAAMDRTSGQWAPAGEDASRELVATFIDPFKDAQEKDVGDKEQGVKEQFGNL